MIIRSNATDNVNDNKDNYYYYFYHNVNLPRNQQTNEWISERRGKRDRILATHLKAQFIEAYCQQPPEAGVTACGEKGNRL